MIKFNKQKAKKIGARAGAGFLAFAAGLAAAFFLVPNRVRNIVFDEPESEETHETYFSKFVTRIMDAADVDSDETLEGINGTIESLTVTWPDNKVVVDGTIALSMRSLSDLDFTLDLGAVYNDSAVELGVGYTGRTFYLALQDLFIKSSYVNTQDVFEKLNYLFFNPETPEEEGLGIKVDLDSIIGSLIGGIDINSLLSGGGGLGLEFGEEVEVETNIIEAPLSIALKEGEDPIEISMYLDKTTNFLSGLDLKHVAFGDVSISGKISLDVLENRTVYGFDNENYNGYRSYKETKFIEVVNYKSWFDDIFKLLNKKTIGIDLNFSADQDDGTGPVNIGQVEGSIDVDASQFILPIPKVIDASLFKTEEPIVEKKITRGADGEETVLETILDNLNAGIQLSAGKADDHYADVNVTYADQCAYLSLNEDVLKTKMDVETINLFIDKLSPLIEGNEDDNARKVLRGEEKENDLFSFITSSELVTAIKDGHYEGIIDLIESLTNSDNGIDLVLNLSSLGLGEDAKVELNLDATDNGEKGVTAIKCSDIKMAEGIFNLDLQTREYKEENISKILNDKDNYQELDFAVGILDQVSGILDSKQAGFALEGSLLGEDGLGMSFGGEGQLDYGARYGFGDITIYNHKNADKPSEISETHPIKLYVDNTSEDKEANNMKLVYGPNGKLKGKLSVNSLEDIVDVLMKLIKKFTEQNDRRFAKFLDPLVKIIKESIIGQIIATKDYMQLAKSSFIKSISQDIGGNALTIELSKDLFAGFVTEDVKIILNFHVKNEVKQLASLQIENLKLNETLGNKIVNLKVTVNDFVENKELPLDLNDTYMDFSSVATLIQFGIDSTELNFYHLKGKVSLHSERLEFVDAQLDFYIEVNGESTKVYGRLPNIPKVIILSEDFLNSNVGSEFVFESAKHYDINSDDSIGGYFHILRSEDHHGLFNRNFEQYYYRATSKGFLDNIVGYLLSSLLNFNYDLVGVIGKINLDSTSGATNVEDMFKTDGFKYRVGANDESIWDVGINLDKVSGISALQSLDAVLSGSKMLDVNGEEKCYLNKLDGDLIIQASILTLYVTANITLEDINPNLETWPIDIDNRFEKICNVYNNMSESNKATYDSKYLNDAEKTYMIKGFDSELPSYLK